MMTLKLDFSQAFPTDIAKSIDACRDTLASVGEIRIVRILEGEGEADTVLIGIPDRSGSVTYGEVPAAEIIRAATELMKDQHTRNRAIGTGAKKGTGPNPFSGVLP